jgi:hypothetical protein
MPTIYVSRNGNSFNLKLRDSEGHGDGSDDLNTTVNAGDTVIWQIDPTDPDISSLASISGTVKGNDPNQTNLLTGLPGRTYDPSFPGGSYFSGTVVSPSPGVGKFENYQIGFTVPGDTTTYYDDPKITMNS